MTRAEIVAYVRLHPRHTARWYADALGLTPGNLGEHLCRAANDGHLIRYGQRGDYRWRARCAGDDPEAGGRPKRTAPRVTMASLILGSIGDGASLVQISRRIGRPIWRTRPVLRGLLSAGSVRQVIRPGLAELYALAPQGQHRSIIPPTIP